MKLNEWCYRMNYKLKPVFFKQGLTCVYKRT